MALAPVSATASVRSSARTGAPQVLLLGAIALSLLLLGLAAAVPPWPARAGLVRVVAAWRLQIVAVGLSTLASAGIVLIIAAEGR